MWKTALAYTLIGVIGLALNLAMLFAAVKVIKYAAGF